MKWNKVIFRKNDIRGIYKKDFHLDFVKALAFSFVQFYLHTQQNKKASKEKLVIAVGHDCRLSSPEIAQHLSHSLALAGAEVRFLGMLPSPVCFFASHFFKDINASIMVTASHNPTAFNGFKMTVNKENICDEKILRLKKIMQTSSFLPAKKKGKITPFDVKPAYISFYQKKPFFLQKKNSHPIKSIAIDCGNGASGPIAKKVFESLQLPIKIHWLYTEPDGRFPHHHPDPSLEKNLEDLQKTLKKKNSDFGAAFDGDGDRLVIVKKTGTVLHGDELMSIFISNILHNKLSKTEIKSPKKNISTVVDVKCADWFFDFLKKNKVQNTMWKSGHSLIRQKTLKKKASFGGELSGHFFFCDDFFPIDDGVYGLVRLILICLTTGKTLEKLLVKKESIETNEIRLPVENMSLAQKRLKFLKEYYINKKSVSCSFIDGVRVRFPHQGWGLARLSNTQNEWTFRFGGKNKKTLKKIQNHFYLLLNISPTKKTIS